MKCYVLYILCVMYCMYYVCIMLCYELVCMGQHIHYIIIPKGFVGNYSLLHTMCSSYLDQ